MKRALSLSILLLITAITASRVEGQTGLEYSGKTSWDEANGTLRFLTNGHMPDTREGFFWRVPTEVRTIVIAAGVRVTGGFRVTFREPSNPLHIVGEDRKTSVIHGTDTPKWTVANAIPENDQWKYGAVSVLEDATVRVSNLTSLNPRGYNISGYASRAVLHVTGCDLIDTRPGDNNNSDGFVGASGSTITDSLISTSDDGIKVYHDITIRDVTIEQHRNGAPIQFGWGGETSTATATIENLTIKGVDPEQLYNMAPFTWEAGTHGRRDVTIHGLDVTLEGKTYREDESQWVPAGLFELKPAGCTLNLRADRAKLRIPSSGLRRTSGTVTINGASF